MSSFIKKSISYQSQNRPDLLQFADEQRKQGLFNDVTIEVENQFIPANRMVLCCYSDYFKKMFRTTMKERYENSVKLTEVDNKSAKLLIDFIYTGNLDIDDENVINLLSAADYLQLDEIKQFCFEFLESIITTKSCFEILAAADLYRDDSLKNKVYQFISLNLNQIIKTESFENLSKSGLTSCITNLDRDLTKETSIYLAVIAWVNQDKKNRENEFPELFKFIRLDKIPLDFLGTVVSNEELVKGNLDCLNLFLEEFVTRASGKFRVDESSTIFGLVRVDDKNFKLCEFDQNFNETRSNFPNLPQINFKSQIFKVDSFLFISAGSAIWRLNLNKEIKEWEEIIKMKEISYLSLYNSCLINISYSNSTVTYIKLPLEENIKDTPRVRQTGSKYKDFILNYSSVCCEGCLYVLGGSYDGENRVNRLPGLNNEWEPVASMQTARHDFTAVSYKHFVFALGGYDWSKQQCTNSVEMFNSIECIWIYVEPMINERRDHIACVVDDKIFVVGGHNNKGDVEEVECYDISRNEWTVVRKYNSKVSKLFSITS